MNNHYQNADEKEIRKNDNEEIVLQIGRDALQKDFLQF